MKTFKFIMAGVLGFFLMLSLVIFGVSFMVKSTALNSDYIADTVEEADITQIASDIFDEYFIEEMPEDMRFFKDVVYEVILDHEPWLKEQFSIAVHQGYDYILKETDSLEIEIPLESIKESVRQSLWVHFLEKIPEWISSPDDEGLKALIYDNIYDFVEGIPEGYLPDEYSQLSEAQLKQYVDAYFYDIEADLVDGQLPPSLEAEIEDLLLPYFNQYYDDIVEEVPSAITATERRIYISEDNIVDIDTESVETVRDWLGVFNTVYYVLIAFMVLCVAGIVLIHFNVKDSTRSIAKVFLVYGIGEFAAVMVARYLVPRFLPTIDWSLSLQNFIEDTYASVLSPLMWFSLGILIAGVALLVFSIFFRRGEPVGVEEED
jgi:hypothetical protein